MSLLSKSINKLEIILIHLGRPVSELNEFATVSELILIPFQSFSYCSQTVILIENYSTTK